MRPQLLTLFAVLTVTAAAGCSQRQTPYRFRGPMVSAVAADRVPGRSDDAFEAVVLPPRRQPATHQPPHRTGLAVTAMTRPAPVVAADPPSASPLAESLRSMVGLREREASAMQFVTSALATIGADLAAEVSDLEDGAALVAYASERGAADRAHQPLLGDLLVFDDVPRGQDAGRLGVVVETRGDGTIEFVYLARGVVRRGWLNRDRPDVKRGADGAVLNTIMRQKDGRGKKGRGDLAGQLLATVIRLDGLSAR